MHTNTIFQCDAPDKYFLICAFVIPAKHMSVLKRKPRLSQLSVYYLYFRMARSMQIRPRQPPQTIYTVLLWSKSKAPPSPLYIVWRSWSCGQHTRMNERARTTRRPSVRNPAKRNRLKQKRYPGVRIFFILKMIQKKMARLLTFEYNCYVEY